MANNRIIFSCDACKESFTVAKYYPSTGWYVFASPPAFFEFQPPGELEKRISSPMTDADETAAAKRFVKRLDEWLTKHSHDPGSMNGDEHLRVHLDDGSGHRGH